MSIDVFLFCELSISFTGSYSALGGTLSLIIADLWDPGTQAPLGLQSQAIKGRLLGATANVELLDVKTEASNICKSSSLGNTDTLEHGRGEVQKWHRLKKEGEGGKKKNKRMVPASFRKAEGERKRAPVSWSIKMAPWERKKRWCQLALATPRESRKTAPTRLQPW